MLAKQLTGVFAPVGVLEQWRVDIVGTVRKKLGGVQPFRRLRRP